MRGVLFGHSMITGIPEAKTYFLSPLKSLVTENSQDKNVEVGGVGMMDAVGNFLVDKQIALVMALSADRCILLVDLTDVECVDILNKAKDLYDAKAKEVINAQKDSEAAK